MQINFGGIDPQQMQMFSQNCASHPGCIDCEYNNEQGTNGKGIICETAIMKIKMGDEWEK